MTSRFNPWIGLDSGHSGAVVHSQVLRPWKYGSRMMTPTRRVVH
jgi:hypothetical protein